MGISYKQTINQNPKGNFMATAQTIYQCRLSLHYTEALILQKVFQCNILKTEEDFPEAYLESVETVFKILEEFENMRQAFPRVASEIAEITFTEREFEGVKAFLESLICDFGGEEILKNLTEVTGQEENELEEFFEEIIQVVGEALKPQVF